MNRLWEIAGLYLALVVAGAIITTPTYPAEQRAAAIAAIVGACLYMARRSRRRDG